MTYKYAWDISGKPFSKWDWLALANPRFQQIDEPQEATIYRVMQAWEMHLQNGTIVLSEELNTNFWEAKSTFLNESILAQQKGKEAPSFLIGCTYCHNVHITEGDGFPSMHLGNKASKECVQHFNRRELVCNEM